MPRKLTLDSIESKTTNSNLERGRLLYKKGFVNNVRIIGEDLVVANVMGQKLYRVFLEYKGDDYEAFCNCLYEPKGQCKHQVALKFSLLDFIKKQNIQEKEGKKLFIILQVFYLAQKHFLKFLYRIKKGI